MVEQNVVKVEKEDINMVTCLIISTSNDYRPLLLCTIFMCVVRVVCLEIKIRQ